MHIAQLKKTPERTQRTQRGINRWWWIKENFQGKQGNTLIQITLITEKQWDMIEEAGRLRRKLIHTPTSIGNNRDYKSYKLQNHTYILG